MRQVKAPPQKYFFEVLVSYIIFVAAGFSLRRLFSEAPNAG
jgi:hypothetical protein